MGVAKYRFETETNAIKGNSGIGGSLNAMASRQDEMRRRYGQYTNDTGSDKNKEEPPNPLMNWGSWGQNWQHLAPTTYAEKMSRSWGNNWMQGNYPMNDTSVIDRITRQQMTGVNTTRPNPNQNWIRENYPLRNDTSAIDNINRQQMQGSFPSAWKPTAIPGQSNIPGPAQQSYNMRVIPNPRGFTPEQLSTYNIQAAWKPSGITPTAWNQQKDILGQKYFKNAFDVSPSLYQEMMSVDRFTPRYLMPQTAQELGAWKDFGGKPATVTNPGTVDQYGYKMAGSAGGLNSPGWYVDVDKGYVHAMNGASMTSAWWMGPSAVGDWRHENRKMGRGGGGIHYEQGTGGGGYNNPSNPYTPYGYLYQALLNWRV